MRQQILSRLGLGSENSGAGMGGSKGWLTPAGNALESYSPIDGSLLATVGEASAKDYETVVETAGQAFLKWRMTPAPLRGQVIREIGQILREHKDDLGALVSMEMGKIKPEGLGEVQEMIDIADFAVGLSRQLYGLTMHSERPHHRLYEQWHPLGPIGVVTAFNFPVAVWSWNALIAAVCGDVVVWKPSSKGAKAMIEDRQQTHENSAADAELCLKLKASLDAAYGGVSTPEAEDYLHWSRFLLSLPETGALDDPPSREELYVAAVNTLQAQALHGAHRPPLAHRIIVDPEAFFMSLATAIKTLGLRY
jgi:hypothetical protein